MTRDETVRLLAVLKAAYPAAFRNMTRADGEAMIALWASELEPFPQDIVAKAVRQLIEKSKFLPSISETLRQIWRVGVELRTVLICRAALGRETPRAELERVCAVVERLEPVRGSEAGASGERRAGPALPA